MAVSVVQSIIDSLTGVLIFKIAGKIFHSQKIAWVSYLLYIFNPFTSVFVTLILSEVWGIFLMTVILYLLILLIENLWGPATHVSQTPLQNRSTSWGSRPVKLCLGPLVRVTPLFVLVALLFGYLPQVRPAFLFYCIAVFIFLTIKIVKDKKDIKTLIIATLLFILPFIYNVAGNWTYFKQFSLTTVDNLLVREFYISLYVPERSPFHAKDPDVFPPEVQKIYNEYTPVPFNEYGRKLMAQKYLNLGLKKVMENPAEFIFSRVRKLWYVWEKHFLFYYEQPENKPVDFTTYWGNNLLIFLGLTGFISWFRKNRKSHLIWFGWLVIFTIGYISLVHSLSLAEERYSLPGYPFIFLFAGYGMWNLVRRIVNIFPHQ